MRRHLLLLLFAALAGCRDNPYSASHLPYPPTPSDAQGAAEADPDSYPPPPIDLGRYRNWQWGVAVDEPLAGIVSAALDQRGLRPATEKAPATLELRVLQRTSIHQRQIYDEPAYGDGFAIYDRHAGYWGTTPVPVVRIVSFPVEVVQLELFDVHSGVRVWTGSGEAVRAGSGPASVTDSLRRAVAEALSSFPPP